MDADPVPGPTAGRRIVAGGTGGWSDLGQYLVVCRSRLQPADVGLPAGARRRAPGLRREEVALLAHISPAWYTRLEQGRSGSASMDVIDAIARALRLAPPEHRYLRALASPPVASSVHVGPAEPDVGDDLAAELAALADATTAPVYVSDRNGDLLVWNAAAGHWYDGFRDAGEARPNIVRWVFGSSAARDRLPHWEDEARSLVGRIRYVVAVGGATDEQALAGLHRESAEFRRWWSTYEVSDQEPRRRVLRDGEGHEQTFTLLVLRPATAMSISVVVHVAASAP